MLKKNDIIEIHIHDLTIEGAGIGKYNGLAVFVPKALPGELVKTKIIKITKKYAVSRLLEIIKPSEGRQKPFCEAFEKCGGCTLQHLAYPEQLKYKSKYIKECFKRIGGIDIDEPEVIASENIRDYRNKASFPVAEVDGRVEAGFYAARSHSIVPAYCPIQKKQINEVKEAIIEWVNREGVPAYDEANGSGKLRHIIARQATNGDIMAGIVINGTIDEKTLISLLKGIKGLKSIVININGSNTNVILGVEERTAYGDPFITEVFDGLKFRAGFSSFLQINYEQAEKLYKMALGFADISKDDIIFDLFCGIGTISLLAAKHAKKVIGIEYAPGAAENAVENARINNIENAAFLAGDAGEMMGEALKKAGKPDIVILDPPRKGCDKILIKRISGLSPKKVVYVSCNPATLARDAAAFIQQGYRIRKVKGIDMFPHTTHIECVVLLYKI